MKRFNLFAMFEAGKRLRVLQDIKEDELLRKYAYPLFEAREVLKYLISDDSPLGGAGKRTARDVIAAVDQYLPNGDFTAIDPAVKAGAASWRLWSAAAALETVLKSELPDVASFVLGQKGIYRTDDLIGRADLSIAGTLRPLLPEQARLDLIEAGKCLAYELGTACVFHLWRAVETVIVAYHVALTGKSFGRRNWGAYIKQLRDADADERVTKFLDHIRDEYRNPQTHPEEMVEIEHAQRLFPVAVSAIELMLDLMRPAQRALGASQLTGSTLPGSALTEG